MVIFDLLQCYFFDLTVNKYSFRDPRILEVTNFCSPNESGNVNLKIGDKGLRVSKEVILLTFFCLIRSTYIIFIRTIYSSTISYFQFLAIHSPVFASIFSDQIEKNGKEEIEIKELDYEVGFNFSLLLLMIFTLFFSRILLIFSALSTQENTRLQVILRNLISKIDNLQISPYPMYSRLVNVLRWRYGSI